MAIPNMLETVLDCLFEPEGRRLQNMVKELDRQNREIKGHSVMGFMYNGQVFIPPGAKTKQTGGYPSLAFSLTNQAAAWWLDRQNVGEDKQFIKQVLWLVVKDCQTLRDFRDALPETIVDLIKGLSDMPREREDGYTIMDNDRLYGQYLTMRDKIDVYWACRMIY